MQVRRGMRGNSTDVLVYARFCSRFLNGRFDQPGVATEFAQELDARMAESASTHGDHRRDLSFYRDKRSLIAKVKEVRTKYHFWPPNGPLTTTFDPQMITSPFGS
jgi:hypothetical protein